MGIKIKRDAKGGYRNWWYAEYREGKKLRTIRLDVRIAGMPPASLSIKEEGNLAFERSKALAQKSFDDFMERRQRKGVSEDILETLIESKLGEKPKYVRLDELAEMWNGIARVKPLCDDRKRNNATVFKEFAKSCKREFLFQVRDDDVKTYYDEICKLFTWATVKSRMSLLSGAFTRFLPHGCRNPFKTIIRRKNGSEGGNIHRVPLTNEQVQKLREYARADSLLYPLIECGIATGARLKDICFMRKDNIDLEEGFVSYIASKTGTLCELPLFPEFRAVVEDIITKSSPAEPLLFPEAAAMHEHNHSGIVRRGKLLFAKALFERPKKIPEPTEIVGCEPASKLSSQQVFELIDTQGFTPSKATRMKDVYRWYVMGGESYRKMEQEHGISKSTIYDHMREIERLTGERIIRFEPRVNPTQRDLLKLTRLNRTGVGRAASAYGWGSLRATFVVLAMQRHVEEKEIINAVGHSDFRTTLKYYVNPTRAHQKEQWLSRMSTTAIGMATSPSDAPGSTMDLGTAKQIMASLTPEQLQAVNLFAKTLKAS